MNAHKKAVGPARGETAQDSNFRANNRPPPDAPQDLAARKQWLVHRDKIPHYADGRRRTGTQGSEQDREALVYLDRALEVVSRGGWSGIGFALLPGDGLIGIDLDKMIDLETGEISERGRGIIEACNSYTEYSPSGKGVHIFCTGETETFKSNVVGVEVFCGRQFLTFTGKRYPGTPDAINPIADDVLRRLRATVESGKASKPTHAAPVLNSPDCAKVESALAFVSPDCGYDDWIKVGMAIHAELGDAGFDVFDHWSARSDKYPGASEMRNHWKSFHPGAITGGTLYGLATDAGWRAPRPVHTQVPPEPRSSNLGDSGGPVFDDWPAPEGEAEKQHVNQPRAVDAMLYGLAGDVGRTAAATTEANPHAVCMAFMSFLSAMAGRDVYLPIGNTRHHPRLFTLHVGRSSRGRKGDALSLVHRIRHTIDRREFERGTVGGSLLGQVHTGGLSTREGLVMFIHDGYMHGKEEVPAIADKRLWVVESEFANVLHQAKRDGNTLSASLRDGWDGVSIKPATKSFRTWASDPHIAIAAAITPTELVELMKARELSNGFANRFIIFWAERERLIPFPAAASEAVLHGLADRTEAVLRFMRGDYPASTDSRAMVLDHDARTAYERIYRRLNATTGSARLDGVLERRAPMLLRMAMLFALSDQTLTIEVRHIEAAHVWVRYWVDSVRYIFGEAADEASTAERQESANKLLAYLIEKGEADRKSITNECFNKRSPAGGLDAVIAELMNATPPRIEAVQLPRRDGLTGKGRTIYRPLSSTTPADIADIADIGMDAGGSYVRTPADLGGHRSADQQPEDPKSAKSDLSPQPCGHSSSRMDSLSPLSPLSPHATEQEVETVSTPATVRSY